MCAQLVSHFGIPVTRASNGSPARKKDEFANADAEKWFAFRRLLEKSEVILPLDEELLKQLSSRRLQYDAKARIQLHRVDVLPLSGMPYSAGAGIGANRLIIMGCPCGAVALDYSRSPFFPQTDREWRHWLSEVDVLNLG